MSSKLVYAVRFGRVLGPTFDNFVRQHLHNGMKIYFKSFFKGILNFIYFYQDHVHLQTVQVRWLVMKLYFLYFF